MKHHGWLWGIALTTALGGTGVWVAGVNADSKKTAIHDAIIPEISNKLTEISRKQDAMREDMNNGFKQVTDRVSNVEGRLSGR